MAEDVTFRRIRGRIVPIKRDGSPDKKRAAGAAAVVGGSALAADAARTSRVYRNVKTGVTIDRKKFSYQPFVHTIGDKLTMRKGGKTVGQARYFNRGGGEFGFSWLGIKRDFRGQGHSKTLATQAVKQMRAKGGKSLFNQVVHPGSMKTGLSARDTFWRERSFGRGQKHLYQMTRKDAAKNIRMWRNKRGVLTSDVFRNTDLRGLSGPRTRPYKTRAMKGRMAIGAGVAAIGATTLLSRSGKDE